MTDTRTLQQAYDETAQKRWRNSPSSRSQAIKAAAALARVVFGPGMPLAMALRMSIDDIGDRDIQQATQLWYSDGLSPATINKRLSCLSAMGVGIGGYVKDPPKLKWWFKPEHWEKVYAWLRDCEGSAERQLMADYILWATTTGLRVEESLRLAAMDFGADFTEVTVPGLKTHASQATLALAPAATAMARHRFKHPTAASPIHGDTRLFGAITYDQLYALWCDLKAHAGWPPEATLKGLRRTAARFLHVDRRMPLDMVRQYLRHEDIETTMGYLRLTGGYSLEEQRGFLR